MRHVILLFSVISLIGNISCNNRGTQKEVAQTVNSTEVKVYYFHYTRRCATCLAVEDNARKAVQALYPDKIKTGDYSFSAFNLDETTNKEMADKLGIGGQTLLVIRGDKKINITSAGFLNAHNPEKMKEEIKSAIDRVLY